MTARFATAHQNQFSCASSAAASTCAHISVLLDTVIVAVSIIIVRVSLLLLGLI